ncbi:hypothetical protein EDF77_3189 [Stenotrophomonas maltophilia]|uniref:hypothetical protein n=1 Tax=Stenotrophomonas chelatiphaga TaxID=517011 RepID=UPI000F4D00C3|nr:hypothetical protein [Stenotrophomonas chelatiphaga]MCS4229927.1 hypothetical protein [Stenotrophomonas chelatiphaga]ROQ38113.1 hypothetical protein EDF77_3189 [Stenotrophomonas maltophilia]
MRGAGWLFPMLMLLGACQRAADVPPAADVVVAGPPAAAAAAPAGTSAVGDADALPLLAAVAADAPDPGAVVRTYAGHLLRRDFDQADASWMVAPPPGRADDAALRSLRDVRDLRISTEPPQARDQQRPTHLIEVPVRVRVLTATTTLRYSGWYRLVPDPQRNGWLIQAARLQPVLD